MVKYVKIKSRMRDLLLIKPLSKYNLQYAPSLGLGFISGYLSKRGFSVDISDCNVQNICPEAIFDRLNIKNYRLIGLQAFDMDLVQVKKYLQVIKNQAPDATVIIGGPAPSSNPEFVLRFLESADFIVTGEGEECINRLLRFLHPDNSRQSSELEQIPNLAWLNDNRIHQTSHEYITDLDNIGPPDWEKINPVLYHNAVHGFFYRRLPALPIMVSRGCPFHCSFCGSRNITGYKVRRRSPEKVIDELEYLKNTYGLREFQIIDDNFTFPPEAAMEFAEKLIARNLDLLWTCPNGLRVDTINKELLTTMKRSGCYEVAVGIESADPQILKDMGKRLSPEIVAEKVRLIYSQGINVVGFIMIGYPLETEETIRKTIKFILSLPLVRISLTRFIPMLGTPVSDRLIANKELKREEIDPTRQNYNTFTYLPPKLKENRLRYLYRLFFIRFVLRPRIIFHNIRNIRSFSHAKILIRKILTFLR